MEELVRELLKNPVFGGIGAASIFGYLLYTLRQVPGYLWKGVRLRFACSVSFYSEDACYDQVNDWLARLDYANRCRRLKLTSRYDYDENEERTVLTPGLGVHWFWFDRHLVLMTREVPDKGGLGSWKRFEDVHLDVYGPRSIQVVRDVVQAIEEASKDQHKHSVNVYLYRHRWRLACRKPKRSLQSVVLPEGQMEGLIDDVQRFIDSRSWYQDRGVPYRRGYYLKGPPGCGKTSLVMALASHFGRPIYVLNLGSMNNDDELIDAVCEVPEHGILLIEDIDAAKATAKRETKAPEGVTPSNTPKAEEKKEISLSAMLNALDGAFSREGRILVMTTNHPEKVDAALTRNGRADYHMEIGPLGKREIQQMCLNFYGDTAFTNDSWKRFVYTDFRSGIPASEVQEKLLALRG